MVPEEKWPILVRHGRAAEWLRVWTDLGRAPRTIDAYAREWAEFLEVCEREGVDPVAASRADVAVFVRALTSRPDRVGHAARCLLCRSLPDVRPPGKGGK
jgi:hypothetical protein